MTTLVVRATFFSNLFSGTQILSSFELARGYQPSVLGIPSTRVSQELIDAHTEQRATRALQRVLRTHTPNRPTPGMFKEGDDIWVWYATTKQNELDEWIDAKVVAVHPHFLEARRIRNGKPCKGPTMKPTYEDVRIAPKGELARYLMDQTLHETMGYANSVDRGVSHRQGEIDPCQQVSSLLSRVSQAKDAHDDIGKYADQLRDDRNEIAATLKSEKSRLLDEAYGTVGSKQVTKQQLAFLPPWILKQAFDKEYESNWKDAFVIVHESEVPNNANIITSHTVFKVKTSEDNTRELKNRIVPHGNRDSEKEWIRKYSATAQLNVIRLMLSIVTFLGFRLATADIKAAHLQSGHIKRDIYVRPPQEWTSHKDYVRYCLWKLIKLPYGIVETGRQWLLVVEEWMIEVYGLERVFGVSQQFLKRDKNGEVVLIIAEVTDDFLIGGSKRQIKHFLQRLEQRFKVGKTVIDSKFYFNGCEIEQDAIGNIKISMMRYLDRIKPIMLSRSRRKQLDEAVTEQEMKQYRALAGTLLDLGNGVLPQASLVVSLMQQRTAALKVTHLVDANEMLKELLQLTPWITFIKPWNTTRIFYCSFSDASHPKERFYGQTGIISGFRIETTDLRVTLFHPIDWTSQKQNRVSYSSYEAEILAAASGDDRGYYFKMAIQSILPHLTVPHELILDSHELFDTIKTLHEATEYRLRPTVQRIRNSFESHELDAVRWIPGTLNVADALTKRNMNLYRMLNQLCSRGLMNIDLDVGQGVDSRSWK